MTFLQALALAHQKREGFFAPGATFPLGTVSWRNNNPGNLRLTTYEMQAYGAVMGIDDFAKFPSYNSGLQALMNDLRAKICGQSAFINYAANPTFLTYVRVFAPADDGNDPNGYCQFLIGQLPQYELTPETPLSHLAALIHADDVQAQQQSLGQQLKIAEEAVGREVGLRRFALTNFIARMKALIAGVH